MILDALQLVRFQTCRRRWLLEHFWQVLRWRPKSLFDNCLRRGVLALSHGEAPESVLQQARTRYMDQSAQPGLDIFQDDPYQVACDYCGMLDTVLTAVSRLTLLQVERLSPVPIAEDVAWQPLAFADESGTLHRWISVDAWDQDAIAREVHSWYTFADMAVLDAPLQLHVVVIGQMRNGRRYSPWVRAFKHPMIAHHLKFQRPDGKGGHRPLKGAQWIPVWYSDLNNADPNEWVNLLDQDGVTPSLLHHPAIGQASEESCRRARQQILQEAQEISKLLQEHPGPAGGMELPMTRNACDFPSPCPWQSGCYRDEPAEGIAELGLYQIREGVSSANSLIPETSLRSS